MFCFVLQHELIAEDLVQEGVEGFVNGWKRKENEAKTAAATTTTTITTTLFSSSIATAATAPAPTIK